MNNFIKNKKGETYFSLSISFFIIVVVFVAMILIMPIFTKKQDLDHFANTMLRQAEIDGTVEQDDLYNYLCNIYGFSPMINWEWDRYNGTEKVQLNKSIKITLESEYKYDVGGFLHQITIPLKTVRYGKSEVYWK